MRKTRNFSRIFVGVVFVFSGFVKGVDPLGTAYRIEDYLIAYGWEWALPFTLWLSVFLCALEFFLGMALLLNFRLKQLSWILLLVMIYFTGLTLYDAIYEPVPNCGCFGDAIALTNWQTFYKNVILIFFVFIIFFYRDKFRTPAPVPLQNIVLTIIFVGFTGFSIYQYNHLPLIDFREWHAGADLMPENNGKTKIYVIYSNKETGEVREYLSPDYPWNDSIWLSEWEFVDQRIDDSDVVKGHNLVINDMEGHDVSEFVIANPHYQFLLVAVDLQTVNREGFKKANRLFIQLSEQGYSFIVLTGSLKEEIIAYKHFVDPHLDFYYADDTELKTVIRSNPGLILLKDGIVIDKWHYYDFPELEDLEFILKNN